MDLFFISAAAIILSIVVLSAYTVLTQVQSASATTMTSNASINAMNKGVAAIETFNYGFVVIISFMGLAGIIYAYLVPTHPILTIISVLVLLISTVYNAIISNAYETAAASSQLSAAAGEFNLITQFMNNLPLIMTVFGALIIIAMFTRSDTGGGTA